MENDVDGNDDRKFLEKVKKPTMLASNSFHSLNVSNNWNIPSNHRNRPANGKGPCDNCGGEQYSPDFPHPCDGYKIKKAKEERTVCSDGSMECFQ